jgi:hypothetical protein
MIKYTIAKNHNQKTFDQNPKFLNSGQFANEFAHTNLHHKKDSFIELV